MIKITEKEIEEARQLIANGNPQSVGYRLLVKPIDVQSGMDESLKRSMPTLGKAGFITKTDEQRERESKGSHYAILVSAGSGAFKGDIEKLYDDVPQPGDVLIFDRYAGNEIELPPGSGEKYRFVNDENVQGRMVKP